MNYYEFQKWIQKKINYDLKYYSNEDFYSISLISNPLLVKNEDITFLKPIYP
jgi:hypothetical protein